MNQRDTVVMELERYVSLFNKKMLDNVSKEIKNRLLSIQQWEVLRMVLATDSVTIKDIAKHLGLTSSAATQIVDATEQMGHVLRVPHKTDKRSVCVVLSPQEKKVFAKEMPAICARLETLCAPATTKELADVVRVLGKITKK